jgi:AhpD family alkylhydroperoxidase
MTQRIDYQKASPEATRAMYQLEAAVRHTGLEKPLLELIKLRVSQINGCAYCLDMHSKDARAAGETEQRLYTLSVWHETTFFTDRERAALEWAEHLTLIAKQRVPDDVFERVSAQFDEKEIVNLTLAVVTINAWNRFSISFQPEVGDHQPAVAKQAETN